MLEFRWSRDARCFAPFLLLRLEMNRPRRERQLDFIRIKTFFDFQIQFLHLRKMRLRIRAVPDVDDKNVQRRIAKLIEADDEVGGLWIGAENFLENHRSEERRVGKEC